MATTLSNPMFTNSWESVGKGIGNAIVGDIASDLSDSLRSIADERTRIGTEETKKGLQSLARQYPNAARTVGWESVKPYLPIIIAALAVFFLLGRGK